MAPTSADVGLSISRGLDKNFSFLPSKTIEAPPLATVLQVSRAPMDLIIAVKIKALFLHLVLASEP